MSSTDAVVPYQEEAYGTYLKELYESRYSPGDYGEDMISYRKTLRMAASCPALSVSMREDLKC